MTDHNRAVLLPTTGTPLAAWPGVTSEQVQVLKTMGIRTVEEIRYLLSLRSERRVSLPEDEAGTK